MTIENVTNMSIKIIVYFIFYYKLMTPETFSLMSGNANVMMNWGLLGLQAAGFFAFIIIICVRDSVWKAIALWKAWRNNQLTWFIFLLIFNTVGILPILYLLFFQKKEIAVTKTIVKNPEPIKAIAKRIAPKKAVAKKPVAKKVIKKSK